MAVVLLLGFGLKLMRELGVNPAQAPSFISLPSLRKPGEQEIKIYFSNEDATRLVPEKRRVLLGAGTAADATAITSELLSGPSSPTLLRTIPPGTRLLNAYRADSMLVLDFTQELRANHPKGSTAELMTVYSIVNTMAENLREITEVQILVEGQEIETLAGHVDLARPLLPERKWTTGWSREITGRSTFNSGDRTAAVMPPRPSASSSLKYDRYAKGKLPA